MVLEAGLARVPCSVNNLWQKDSSSGERSSGGDECGGSVQQVPLDGLAYSTLWKTLLFSIAEYSYVRAGCAKCWRGRRL